MRHLDSATSRGMTWVCFTIHAAMAVKVWFGKLRVNQRFLRERKKGKRE
jgi:hypothetical protein